MARESSKLGYAVRLCDFFSTLDDSLLSNKSYWTDFTSLTNKLGLGNVISVIGQNFAKFGDLRLMIHLALLSDRWNLTSDICDKIEEFWLAKQAGKPANEQSDKQTENTNQPDKKNNNGNTNNQDSFDMLSYFEELTNDVFIHFCNYLPIDNIILGMSRVNRQLYCMIDNLSFWQKYKHNKSLILSLQQIYDIYKNQSELYCYSNGNLSSLQIKFANKWSWGRQSYGQRCNGNSKCYFWLLLNKSEPYQQYKYDQIFSNLKSFNFPYQMSCYIHHLPFESFYGKFQNSNVKVGSICGGKDLDVKLFSSFCTNYDQFYQENVLKTVQDSIRNGDSMHVDIPGLCGKTVISHVYNFHGLATHLIKLHKLQNQLFLKIGPKLIHSTQYDIDSFDTFFKVFHNYIKVMNFVFGPMNTQDNSSVLTYFFDKNKFINDQNYTPVMKKFFDDLGNKKKGGDNFYYYEKNGLLPKMEVLNFLIAMNNNESQFERCCNVLKLMFEKHYLIKLLNWNNSVKFLRIPIAICYNIAKNIYLTKCIGNENDFKGIQRALSQLFITFRQLETLEIGFSLLGFEKIQNDCEKMLEYFHKQIVEFMLIKNVVSDNGDSSINTKLTSLLIFYHLQPSSKGKIAIRSKYDSLEELDEYNKNRTKLTSEIKSNDSERMQEILCLIQRSKQEIKEWVAQKEWYHKNKNKLYQRFDFEWRI